MTGQEPGGAVALLFDGREEGDRGGRFPEFDGGDEGLSAAYNITSESDLAQVHVDADGAEPASNSDGRGIAHTYKLGM